MNNENKIEEKNYSAEMNPITYSYRNKEKAFQSKAIFAKEIHTYSEDYRHYTSEFKMNLFVKQVNISPAIIVGF